MTCSQWYIHWFGWKSLDTSISKYWWKNNLSGISLKTTEREKIRKVQNYQMCVISSLLSESTIFLNGLTAIMRLTHRWTEQMICKEINICDLPFISRIIKELGYFRSINIKHSLVGIPKNNKVCSFPIQYHPYGTILMFYRTNNDKILHMDIWRNYSY